MDQQPTQPPQIVVAGHACLDVIPRLGGAPRFDPGKLITIGPADVSTGGAVSNVGLALRRLGLRTRLIAKIGDDVFGREVLRAYSAVDPDLTRGMIVAPGEATSYTLVMSPPNADRCFLHCPGANDTFDVDDLDLGAVRGARVLHFGYPPVMRRMHDPARCAALLAGVRSSGVRTSLDMCGVDPASDAGRVDWAQWLAVVLPHVDYFVPSVDEVQFMLGRPGQVTRASIRDLSRRLLDLGAGCVMLKLGDLGAYVRRGGDEAYAPCYAVDVVGTTGAGDCTIAGFLTAVVNGQDLAAAIDSATAVGACSCEAADATSGIPPWDAVVGRVHRGWAKRPTVLS